MLVDTEVESAGCGKAAAPSSSKSRDLTACLRALLDTAQDLLAEPLRPVSENHAGYIEGVSVDTHGNVWVVGWLKRSLGHEFPVVIVDRRKYAGAMSVMCYEREDLPADAHAMIGVLQTDWRPNLESADIFLFLGEQVSAFLRAVRPLRFMDGKAVVDLIAGAQSSITEGRVRALQSLLLGAGSWLPDTARIAGFTVEASVDEILALPGFGCLVQGWVVSPAKPVSRISMRLGEKVLHPAVGSLSFRPRPDLVSVYPQAPYLLQRAGFIVALEGAISSEDLANPVLKVHFADGTSSNFSVDHKVMRRIGHAVPADEVLRLYPGLAQETFFGRFAAALTADVTAQLSQVHTVLPCEPSDRCLVAALPANYSDATLLANEIALRLSTSAAPPAVTLLADWSHERTKLPLLAEVIRARTGRSCGVFLVERADKPLWALPRILTLLGCSRFFFLAADAFPNHEAWAAAMAALGGEEPEPLALRMRDADRLAGFVWNSKAFGAWSRRGLPLGARHGDTLARQAKWLTGTAISVGGPAGVEQVLDEVDNLTMVMST